ncbi:MAG: cytochrome c biogenesis protein ResB [Planctomycetota bacterium]
MTEELWKDEPRWLRVCADPRIIAVTSAWLLVLIILGTVAQGSVGLYQAQETYFTNWITWLGPVPTPGGRLVLSVTGLNLLAMLFTHHGLRSMGLFFVHAGMLLLLVGSLLGSAFRQEGTMTLFDGEQSHEMIAGRHHELAVRISGTDSDQMITWGESLLAANRTLNHPQLATPLAIVRHLTNTRVMADGSIVDAPSEVEVERNLAGLMMQLPNGRLLSVREFSDPVHIAPGVTAQLRRIVTRLPFLIELVHFQRDDHPGTSMAKEFSSEALIHTDGVIRRVVISMNRPFRKDDWTVYQSGFTPDGRGTVFSIVRDRFQLSPYIASTIMLVGLLMNLAVCLRPRRQEPS